jgi:hypothetical protein
VPRKATKDTYATEDIGGTEVRRQVFAGDIVPDSYQLEDDSTEEVEDKSETRVGGQSAAGGEDDSSAAYGDSADPKQKVEAEKQQSEEQQKSAQSPAGKRAGRDK